MAAAIVVKVGVAAPAIIDAAATAVAVLSIAAVVSCNGNSKGAAEFKPSLDKNTRCSIKVVGDYDNFEALEAEFDRFNDYYPNVVLSYRKKDSYVSTLANSLSSEDAPNIFFSYAAWMSGDATYSSIVPHMEDLSDPALNINLDCLRPGLVNHDANGKTFMAPVFSRTYGAMVNSDIFAKEGINLPNTWDELIAACQSLVTKEYANPMMGYSKGDSSCWMNTVAYPAVVAALANNSEALAKANSLDPTAGEYLRDALNKVKQLVDSGAVNIEECDNISDNYKQVLLRFFEGDVPMMVCTADTVSGRKKREKESDAFKNNPFSYTFVPIPMNDQGGYFVDSPSVQFSVNKDCKNLDMTNEFMRFLFQQEELKNMAYLKGLISPTKEHTFGAVYASFGEIPENRTFFPEAIGIKDALVKQLRLASYRVGRGEMTVDEAVANYGQF